MNRFATPFTRPRCWALFATLTLALLAGCGGGGSSTTPAPMGGDPITSPSETPGWRGIKPDAVRVNHKKWTFLVYMNAANDLEANSDLNLNQMEQVGSTNDVNIVVQVKRISNRYGQNFTDWKDNATRIFYVIQDNDSHIKSPLLYQNDTLDMGDPKSLREFVDWGAQNFPADRYALVLWNHGAGWRSRAAQKTTAPTRGVSYDDVTNHHIDTIAVPGAIRLPGGAKWDLLAWDSSLMQMAEVAYEVRNEAAYIVGSEESPPEEGYPYDAFLRKLVAGPGMDGKTLGVHIARDMVENYRSDLRYPVITQSVLDASKLAAVAPAVDRLGAALLAVRSQYGQQIQDAYEASDRFAQDYYSTYPYYDIVDFGAQLTGTAQNGGTARVPDGRVTSAVADVGQAVQAAVIFEDHRESGNPATSSAHGLSLFLPTAAQYRSIDRDQADGVGSLYGNRYTDLAFVKAAPNWQSFVAQGVGN